MKIGDLVRYRRGWDILVSPDEEQWVGVIVGFAVSDPIVMWSESFPHEHEYQNQLEVISESR